MSSPEIHQLCTILTREQILEIAANCPSLRLPVKKIDQFYKRKDFQSLYRKHNIQKLANDLQISLATAYNWKNQK
jgi:hypothetical protein